MKFSVCTVMTPDLTPEQLIKFLNEFGYQGVEWRFKETPAETKKEEPSFWRNNLCTISPDISDEELSKLLKLTNDNGIEVTSISPYLTTDNLAETERVLQVAQKLEASSIRVGV